MSVRYLIMLAVCICLLSWGVTYIPPISKAGYIPKRTISDSSSLHEKYDQLTAMQYHFVDAENPNEYAAINEHNQLGFVVGPDFYTVKKILSSPDAKSFDLSFTVQSVQERALDQLTNIIRDQPDRLLFQYPGVDIEYVNTAEGLRQNFIISRKIDGSNMLTVKMNIHSSMAFSLNQKNELVFRDKITGKQVMAYDHLKVWDADHKELSAKMVLLDDQLSLEVDDTQAKYPVTVDPLNHVYEWASSADGILPALLTNGQLQIDALYGFSSASLGDINNDGYDDMAIGAPGAVNIVAGNTFLQAGAVFVFYGSSTGLAATPSKILRPTTPVAGALFGFSVASGDIVGNSRKDIVVGAPLDSYQTTAVTAIVGTSTATVTSGKVYIFRAEDLTPSTPSAFLEVKLEGTDFFSKGLAGLLLSNIATKNLFGFSIAVTDDMNNDAKGELVVGVPGYLGIDILAVRSGAAFVYYSNDLSTTTPVQLTTPDASLLGIVTLPIANTNGLLFGYSVDGAGDFNGDNFPDLVVGAPAGVDLNSLAGIFSGKILSGSAYVYYGTHTGSVGTGISPTTNTRLQPSASGLLGNAANLFGYSVKGVRNASGVRNGRILIGAPAGSILSNVVGGLRLKTGNVYVFKTYAAGAITADQQISSPRGSSLLSVLNGANLSVSALFGASMDNTLDINCDGISDIIVGEPLSTGVGLIGVDAIGGAAMVFTGNADGTYNTTPFRTISTVTSMDFGVNVASMLGYSVAGAGHTHGFSFPPRVMVGAPGKALDFGTGLLDLGNTFSTLFSFTSGNNGLGKAYAFQMGSCSVLPATLLSFKAEKVQQAAKLTWTTTGEINVSHFEVLHSTNGLNFRTLGEVTATAGKSGKQDYAWKHVSPVAGANFYRLKIVDKDGAHTLSPIAQLNFDGIVLSSVTARPNPLAGQELTLGFDGFAAGAYRIEVLTASGQRQQVRTALINGGGQSINIHRFNAPSGIYMINIYDSKNHLVVSKKVIYQ